MDFLLVLALNFSDGGSQVTHTYVPSKEACIVVLQHSLAAYAKSATAEFKWSASCIDVKNPMPVVPPPMADPPKPPTFKSERNI